MKQSYVKPTAVAVELSFEEHIAVASGDGPVETACGHTRNNEDICMPTPGSGWGHDEGMV